MDEKFLKASEVAKKYGVNSYTVKGWIRSGLFPNAKLEETIAGSVWLIPESDLENFKKPEMGRPKKTATKE
ncbi:MAG: helix-turn-helix domain-containing protein [Acidobacteria bacterium]|nr:helix-turn-helix domain-containing protein [Acidobacteriota bacterium]MCA1639339.1 helix-turn-helix domain-containing protein [Acidobacteriota bacterium]